MVHLKALGIKWLYTVAILFSLLAIFDNFTFGQVIILSLILTGISYVVGDLMILPAIGMVGAAIADFGLSFLIVWFMSGVYIGQSGAIVLASLTAAYFFALCEGLFHAYMRERVLPRKQAAVIPFPNMNLQTEASEELYPEKKDTEKEK